MGLICVCLLLLCWCSLANANGAPTILDDGPRFVCEDVPIGHSVFTIRASDPDNDPLVYALEGVDASFFSVDSSGTVFAAKTLDRETKQLMELTATVSDSINAPTRASIIILVSDANDNRPIFEEASYEMSVAENTAVGTTLFKVIASDDDSGNAGSITFRIDESVPSSGQNTFSIDPLFGNVILNGNLNFTHLSTFYRLKINASDNGGNCFEDEIKFQSSSIFAFITVVDVPDLDPEFIGLPYTPSVEENSDIGKPVITVSAFDPDTGINDEIVYDIQASTADGLFTIDGEGVISVNSMIDREVIGDMVELTVKATETKLNIHGVEATSTAQVRITITDINDNEPRFYQCADADCVLASSFSGEVQEHSLEAVFINMTVKDADKNAITELSLDGDGKDMFSVQPSEAFSDSPVQLTVKNPEDLDYEKIQQVTLKVIAVDKENSILRSTANVAITILDANDHSPDFGNDTFYAKVPEHCPDGTTVTEITANDPDTMDQGKITYSLLPESIRQYFDVEPTTGRIYVKNGALLDREIRALYSMTLQARDSDGKPGSAVLEITVTDINDKTPVPNRNTYQEFVFEGENLENVKIEATDGDEPDTPNSQLVFTIEPGPFSMNFSIDPDTGVLTNNGPLDREDIDSTLDGKIELSVNISDKGSPPLSTVVQVIINVQDVNDNKPEFEKLFYNFTVKESDKGAFVGSVYAEDQDQTTEFNRISFSIIEGSFGSFIISSVADAPGYFGNIKVDQDVELDYESGRKSFSLQVEAADLPQETAEVTVEVHVLDVNDERPEFRPIPAVDIEENSKETEPIGKFDAVDKDTNSSLVYELLSVKCMCSGEEQPCDWFVLDPNGEVRVNPEASLDYESCVQAIVEAQVVDENTEKGESNSASPGEMVINIKDMNDNTPEFIYSNSVFVVVSESANPGTSVAGVSATDRDSGVNAQIEFQVSKVQFIDMNGKPTGNRTVFEAITTQQKDIYVGIIQTTEQLNIEAQGKYLVTVEARDTGGLTNTTELEIFMIAEGYKNELKFGMPLEQVQLQEADIKRSLTVCTQAAVHVVAIREDTAEPARASDITVMEAYFVFGNGTALTSKYVETTLSLEENYQIMSLYKLIYVGSVDPAEPEPNLELYVLFGMVGGLIIVTAVLTTSLLCTRRNYRRKLKAANAMKSASNVMSDNQRGGPVVPGTNLYTMEGANPVLNLNIDAAIALGLGEDSDVDRVSLNSLDNSDDMMVIDRDTQPIVKTSRQDDEDKDSGLPDHVEPLGAALAQRDHKIRSNNPLLGDTNPVFDTTDL